MQPFLRCGGRIGGAEASRVGLETVGLMENIGAKFVVSQKEAFVCHKLSLAQLRQATGCVRLGQIFRAPLIRDAKDLVTRSQLDGATGANEHPCAVAPLGYIPVPELPTCVQVLSISNAFCIHICPQTNIIPGDCLTLQRQF